MQKKFIALAVAGLVSGAAFAQSNVTVYGVADGSFDVVNRSGGSNTTYDPTTGNEVGASTSTGNVGFNRVSANSSYIGFKGTEALGNGLNAVFQFESTVSFDAASAITNNRDSFVGLSGGFGTVVLGNLTGPTRALGAALDVNAGATGVGANSALLGKLGNNLTNFTTDGSGNPGVTGAARSQTQASMFDTRWKNAIAYVSPSFGGVTATAAYVANENKTNAINTSGYDLGLNYANGPIMAGLTYNAVTVKNDAALGAGSATAGALVTNGGVRVVDLGANIKTNDLRIGGSYDFKVVKINALFDRVTLKADGLDGDLKQNVWGLGAIVPVGAGRVIGQFYKANNINDTNNTGAKLYELGYVHSLSKRTELRAVYARINNDSNANYDFGVNASGLNGASAAAGVNGNVTVNGLGSSVSALSLGLRHTF